MTRAEISARLDELRNIADDPEAAHGREDELMRDFIRHVATVAPDTECGQMAALVLMSSNIRFSRWYA